MNAAQERAVYLRGIQLFNEGQFFEGHEAWEEIWRGAEGVKREFLQGMIQAAVALEHYRRGNPRGVVNLWRSCRMHMGRVQGLFMGVDVGEFLAEMERALAPVVRANPPAKRGEIRLDLSIVPKVRLKDEPPNRPGETPSPHS